MYINICIYNKIHASGNQCWVVVGHTQMAGLAMSQKNMKLYTIHASEALFWMEVKPSN